jgi:hypothetical protein
MIRLSIFDVGNSYNTYACLLSKRALQAGVRAFMRDPVEGNRYLLDFDLFGVDN